MNCSNVVYVVSLLSGEALACVSLLWEKDNPCDQQHAAFLALFWRIFDACASFSASALQGHIQATVHPLSFPFPRGAYATAYYYPKKKGPDISLKPLIFTVDQKNILLSNVHMTGTGPSLRSLPGGSFSYSMCLTKVMPVKSISPR